MCKAEASRIITVFDEEFEFVAVHAIVASHASRLPADLAGADVFEGMKHWASKAGI